MESRAGLIFSNISWLMLSKFTAKIISLAFLPIITAYLDPESYGLIALLLVESSLLAGFFDFGLSSFTARVIYKYDRRHSKKCAQYVGILLCYLTCFSLIGVVLCYPFAKPLARFFIVDIDRWPSYIFYIPLAYAFFHAISGFATSSFIYFQKNNRLFFCEFLEFFLIFPVQIIGLIWFKFTWIDVVLLQLYAKIALTFFALWLLRDRLGFSFRKLKIIKYALRFSWPFVLLNFVSSIQSQVDKILLGNLTSVSNVGVYVLGNKLSEGFSFFSRPLMLAMKPEISKRLDSRDPNIEPDITDFFNIFFQLSLFFIFSVAIFAKEILHLLAEAKYSGAFLVIPFLMFGYMLGEASGLFQLKLFYKNQTGVFPAVTFVGALASTLLNLVLIPKYKAGGAALAVFLTSVITFFIFYFLSQRASRSNYNLVKNMTILILIILILHVQDFFKPSLYLQIFKGLGVSIYALILFQYFERTSHRFRYIKEKVITSLFVKNRLGGQT